MNPLEALLEKRSAAAEELEGILRDPETGVSRESLTDEQETRSEALLGEIDEFDVEIRKQTEIQEKQNMLARARGLVTRSASVDAQVVEEKMVYGPESRNSFYLDMITLDRKSAIDPRHRAAQERMLQWSDQVEREVAEGSEFGKVAERQLREIYRDGSVEFTHAVMTEVRERGKLARELKDGVESRAILSGGGTTASAAGGGAAAFVTPVFGTPYIPYREYGRAFADQCAKGDLPDYGLAIYKPQVTGPGGVSQLTEGNAVTEVDPAAGLQVATLVEFAGQVTLSQLVLDRMAPDYRFDVMCEKQMAIDYAPKFDKYVLAQSLANATSQGWTGNSGKFELTPPSGSLPGSGGFYGQVSLAKANMRKLVGTVLNPSCLFLDPARYEYIAAWSDVNGRPVIVPDYAGPFNAVGNSGDGDAGIEGYTGTRFNGLPVYTDANIPTTGGTLNQDQALVSDLNEVEVYEGNPVNRVLPQTLASSIEVILQRYSYATVFINYAAAVTTINGTGMSAITYTG